MISGEPDVPRRRLVRDLTGLVLLLTGTVGFAVCMFTVDVTAGFATLFAYATAAGVALGREG